MKIKFIKEYRAYRWLDGSLAAYDAYEPGRADNVDEDEAQWLINNGFAEKVDDEWPREGDKYWMVCVDGYASYHEWNNSSYANDMKAIGNVFKTEESAKRFVDYLKAVETVRHDEGFMKKDNAGFVYPIIKHSALSVAPAVSSRCQRAGELYFDSYEHSNASLDKHRDEWKTILNYKWGKE